MLGIWLVLAYDLLEDKRMVVMASGINARGCVRRRRSRARQSLFAINHSETLLNAGRINYLSKYF